MTIVRRLLPAALLVVAGADALKAQAPAAGQLQNAWTSPCTLSVVLVTFRDTTARHPGVTDALGNVSVRADTFDYHLHDRPHGYTVNRTTGALEPGTSSYTMDDWERMFSGGYRYSENGETGVDIPAFTGTQIVADNDDGVSETLPEVFGSLRHYFHVISGGDETSDPDFELRVRMLNEEDRDGYPIWVELPETKGYYAERARRTLWNSDYWLHARNATLDSVRSWDLDSTAYDPPGVNASQARRLRHKVLYLYAGAQFNDPGHPLVRSQIHPQADGITSANPNPAILADIDFRYVAAERQGSGRDSHEADRFGGIGIHAHEIGHLLGFSHPDGRWDGTEVYTRRTATCANRLSFGQGGRMAGWAP